MMKDAARKRREYLRSVAQAELAAGVALSVAVVFGLVSACSLFVALLLWSMGNATGISLAIGLVLYAFVSFGGWKYRQAYARKARSIPYVPPVAEQIANLPAEEILVRGAEEPTVTPEELLRATCAAAEVSSDELLRAESKAMP